MQDSSFYNLKATAIDGTSIDFSEFQGKKVMIVNTASRCGYTPQYEDLQLMHQEYGDQLAILGFPSNNFGGQEPGSNDDIVEFCQANYGVTFQMFEKVEVQGFNQHAVYQWLTDPKLNGKNSQAPAWNFCKYLINEKGEFVHFLGAGTNPGDQEILEFVES